MTKEEELVEHYRKQIAEICCELATENPTTNYYEFNNDFAVVKLQIKNPLIKFPTDERTEWLKELLIHLDKIGVNKDKVIQEAFANGILSASDLITLQELTRYE